MECYGFCNAEHESTYIVPVLASVLNQLIARNDKMPINPEGMTRFHAFKPPSITVQNYLNRVVKYVSCSTECFIMALIYIDRIIQRNTYFIITSLNVHRLLITSIMLAMKFFEDSYYTNAYYARVGGVSCSEMNALELDFLFLIDFSLNVTPDLFNRYRAELVKHAFNYCGCPCGTEPVSMSMPRQQHTGIQDCYNFNYNQQQFTPATIPKQTQYIPSPHINQFDHIQPPRFLVTQNSTNHSQNLNKNNSAFYQVQQPISLPTQSHYPQQSHYQQQQQQVPITPQYQIKVPVIPPQIVPQQPQLYQSKMHIHENYSTIDINDIPNLNHMPTNNNINIDPTNESEYSPHAVLSACNAMVEDEVKRMRLSPEIIPRASQLFFKEVMKYRSFSPYVMCCIMQRVCESLEKENMFLPRANLVARAKNAEAYIKTIM